MNRTCQYLRAITVSSLHGEICVENMINLEWKREQSVILLLKIVLNSLLLLVTYYIAEHEI